MVGSRASIASAAIRLRSPKNIGSRPTILTPSHVPLKFGIEQHAHFDRNARLIASVAAAASIVFRGAL
jgi:hypothetical protein